MYTTLQFRCYCRLQRERVKSRIVVLLIISIELNYLQRSSICTIFLRLFDFLIFVLQLWINLIKFTKNHSRMSAVATLHKLFSSLFPLTCWSTRLSREIETMAIEFNFFIKLLRFNATQIRFFHTRTTLSLLLLIFVAFLSILNVSRSIFTQ